MPNPLTRCALMGLVVSLIGCARVPEVGEVEGVVRLNGKPLPQVAVAFLPDVAEGAKGATMRAVTDDSGHYRFPYDPAKGVGAVVGVHRVLVDDAKAKAEHSPKSRVPAAYEALVGNPLGTRVIQTGKQTIDLDLVHK